MADYYEAGESVRRRVARLLEADGCEVVLSGRCDLYVVFDGCVLQVAVRVVCGKYRRKQSGDYYRWYFNLCGERWGYRECDQPMVYVCIAVNRDTGELVPFVIPASVFSPGQGGFELTSDPLTYSGKYADYRVEWFNLVSVILVECV